MLIRVFCVALVLAPAPALAQKTDWGIRVAPSAAGEKFLVPPKTPYLDPSLAPLPGKTAAMGTSPVNMGAIARIGAQWGRVTSTYRSVQHNRAVGGVPNSYHLSGRAIDIARRPGVSHWQVATALRQAGYHLLESLDEGDHSHFAFGSPGQIRIAPARKEIRARMVTDGMSPGWKIVYAPGAGN